MRRVLMLTTQTSPYSGVCEKFVDNVMRFENLINPTTPRVMGRWAAMIINQIGNDLSRAEECLIWDEQQRSAKANPLI